MQEKRVFVRTPDGYFFTARFAGRDSQRNYLLNGRSIPPTILELFVSIQHPRLLEIKVTHPDFLGGTTSPEFTPPLFHPNSFHHKFDYIYRRTPDT